MRQRIDVTEKEGTLEVTLSPNDDEARADRLRASVTIATSNPALADKLTQAIAQGMVLAVPPAPPVNALHVRTRRRAASLTTERVRDAVVIVVVSERNARHLVEIVDAARKANPLGVQLVWDGVHARDRIFEVLERARGVPNRAPVFVTKTSEPCFLLRARAERKGIGC